jgi:hypothetical protein
VALIDPHPLRLDEDEGVADPLALSFVGGSGREVGERAAGRVEVQQRVVGHGVPGGEPLRDADDSVLRGHSPRALDLLEQGEDEPLVELRDLGQRVARARHLVASA